MFNQYVERPRKIHWRYIGHLCMCGSIGLKERPSDNPRCDNLRLAKQYQLITLADRQMNANPMNERLRSESELCDWTKHQIDPQAQC